MGAPLEPALNPTPPIQRKRQHTSCDSPCSLRSISERGSDFAVDLDEASPIIAMLDATAALIPSSGADGQRAV